MPASISSLLGTSVPIGAIVQGQFASDSSFLPCDGSDQLVANYPLLDKTNLGTFGTNTSVARTVLSQSWGCVAYGNGTFVAVANGGSVQSASCSTSVDGATWTTRAMASAQYWNGVIFAAGLFVAWASTGSIQTSPDGITWTARSGVGSLNNYSHLAYGNGMFVAVVNSVVGATYYTSPDGITWTTRTNLPSNAYYTYGLSFAAGKFWITTDNAGLNYVSTDGITWSTYAPSVGLTTAYKYFMAGNVLYSGAGARSSNNGLTWSVDSTLQGAFFGYGGLLFSSAGSFRNEYGGAWASMPGASSGWWQWGGCVANNRIVFPYGSNIYTLDFDTAKFRTPASPRAFDTDRYFIRAK